MNTVNLLEKKVKGIFIVRGKIKEKLSKSKDIFLSKKVVTTMLSQF